MPDRTSRALLYYALHPWYLFAQLARARNAETVDDRLCFVMGPPRSGTTLVHRLLLNHPAIEGFSYETSIISPKPIFDYRRFSDYLSRDEHKSALDRSRSLAGFLAQTHEVALPQPPTMGWFVEKTPQHARRLRYILDRFPNSRVIFCVRDARDTFSSARSSGNIPQASSLSRHAKYYLSCLVEYLQLIDENDPRLARIYLLKYEDLVASPMEHLAKAMQFLDLKFDPESQLNAAHMAGDARRENKAFKRLVKPITAETVGRWRSDMSDGEAALYAEIAGDALEKLGYARR